MYHQAGNMLKLINAYRSRGHRLELEERSSRANARPAQELLAVLFFRGGGGRNPPKTNRVACIGHGETGRVGGRGGGGVDVSATKPSSMRVVPLIVLAGPQVRGDTSGNRIVSLVVGVEHGCTQRGGFLVG